VYVSNYQLFDACVEFNLKFEFWFGQLDERESIDLLSKISQ